MLQGVLLSRHSLGLIDTSEAVTLAVPCKTSRRESFRVCPQARCWTLFKTFSSHPKVSRIKI